MRCSASVVVWPLWFIARTRKAEQPASSIMYTCQYNSAMSLAEPTVILSIRIALPDDCACALLCGEERPRTIFQTRTET